MMELAGATLRVKQSIRMDTARDLAEQGSALLAANTGVQIVDLAEVPEADSSALTVLFAWLREGAARGHSFKIAHAPQSLLSLAGLYGVTELLPLA